jgi:hypothetical protein
MLKSPNDARRCGGELRYGLGMPSRPDSGIEPRPAISERTARLVARIPLRQAPLQTAIWEVYGPLRADGPATRRKVAVYEDLEPIQ